MKPTILIIGDGLSAMMAALQLSRGSCRPLLISSNPLGRSNAVCIRSGIAAVMNADEDDSYDTHLKETITGGEFLANQGLVKQMCEKAPSIVNLLQRMGVPFNRTSEGSLDFQPMYGSSIKRSLFVNAGTGAHVMRFLRGQIQKLQKDNLLECFDGWDLLSLILDGQSTCHGVVMMNQYSGEIKSFKGDGVILCSGGMGRIFGRTTQSITSTGSIDSILYQQGVPYANGEFIQATPATIACRDHFIDVAHPALEFGARLWVYRDGKPWYFVEDFYSDLEGKIPSMVMSLLIHKVIFEMGLGIKGKPCVYLDFSHLKASYVNTRLREIANLAEKFAGVDISESPLPIFPSHSSSMGGLWVQNDHQTNLKGVFAAGEAQYQYHGAHQLPDNLLLASLFGGLKAAEGVMHYVGGMEKLVGGKSASILKDAVSFQENKNQLLLHQSGDENVFHLYEEMTKWMTDKMGLVRKNDQLQDLDEHLQELMMRYQRIQLKDQGQWMNRELIFSRHLWNMLELSRAIVASALHRNESRGCHYKSEYPDRDDNKFLKTTKAVWSDKGPQIEYEDVELEPIRTRHKIGGASREKKLPGE